MLFDLTNVIHQKSFVKSFFKLSFKYFYSFSLFLTATRGFVLRYYIQRYILLSFLYRLPTYVFPYL